MEMVRFFGIFLIIAIFGIIPTVSVVYGVYMQYFEQTYDCWVWVECVLFLLVGIVKISSYVFNLEEVVRFSFWDKQERILVTILFVIGVFFFVYREGVLIGTIWSITFMLMLYLSGVIEVLLGRINRW